MASQAMISCASVPVVVSNKAGSSPFSVGLLGPRNVSLSSSPSSRLKNPSSRLSMVVRAQQQQQGAGSGGQQFGATPNPVPAHAPWTTTEDDRWFKVRLDMPGVGAEDIDVKVEGDMLIVKDLGRQMYSPYDTKIQLPSYCVKQNINAVLDNGVLHISVQKASITQPVVVHVPVVHVPIKRAPM